jgi:NodT family efflux transporter outer membrane factor (OMF) lipoprotein
MTRISLFVLPLAAVILCGCTVGPDFQLPQTQAAPTYAAAGDAPPPSDQKIVLGKKIEGDWWTQFQSPSLDAVVRLAISGNLDIAAMKARVAQAREEVNAAEGALLPQVSLDATAGRQKYGVALFGPSDFHIPPFTYYELGPSVSFPLDLFGGRKRKVEQQEAFRKYQSYELDAAYLSLTANVAARALAAAAAHAQLDVLQGIIRDDQRNLSLVETAFKAGSVARVQLLVAQSQLANDNTLAPDVRQQESVARHALAILVGKAPADWAPPDFKLEDFTLPQEIPASLPSELVHRRPDILAAEAQLHMASAAIGVATADLYPNIDLTGALTQEALTPGGLFNSVAAAWSLAANLTQPLFDGGQRSAKRRAAVDAYKAALATYRQTIVKAFGDVADRLQALANDAARVRAQTEAVQSATASLDLQRQSYAVGNSGILDVIDAQRSAAQAEIGLARAKAQRLMDTAQLYMALGGNPLPAAEKDAEHTGKKASNDPS